MRNWDLQRLRGFDLVYSTSPSLLVRLRQPGDKAAWDRFVGLYSPLIYRWGVVQGLSSDDAADLVQDVLVVLLRKIPEFDYDPNQRFRGWLRAIALNKVRERNRYIASRNMTALYSNESALATNQSDCFEESEYRSFLVNRALDLMKSHFPEQQWQACWKQLIERRSPSDVALELGMTVNAVYLAKSRVLKMLREELKGLLD